MALTDPSSASSADFIPVGTAEAASSDFIPVEDSNFIPVAPATRESLEKDPGYLKKLTPGGLAQLEAQRTMAGAGPEELQRYEDAAVARRKENALIPADRRTPEEKKAVGDAPEAGYGWDLAPGSGVGDPFGIGQKIMSAGQGMFHGLFTQADTLGKAVTRSDLMAVRHATPVETAQNPKGGVPVRAPVIPDTEHPGAELLAAAKANTIRSANMVREAVSRIANKLFRGPEDDEAYRTQHRTDVGARIAGLEAEQGKSVFGPEYSQSVDAANVQAIQASPLSDPTMFIPMHAGFGAGNPAQLAAGTLETQAKAGLAARAAAGTLKAAANGVNAAAGMVRESPIVTGLVAAGIAAANGSEHALATGLAGTVLSKQIAARLVQSGQGLERAGDRLLGKIPPGPIGRFAATVNRALAPEFKSAAMGQISNTPFLLGSDDEDQFKNMLTAGLVAHAGARGVGGAVSGLDIAKNYFSKGDRAPEVRMTVRDVGVDPQLDVAHQKVVSTLNNSSNNFVESIRKLFSGDHQGELYTLFPEDYSAAIDNLVKTGRIEQDVGAAAKQQQGFTFSDVNEDGTKRNVALSRVGRYLPGLSVGHESGHLLELSLSPDELNHIYQKTEECYKPEQLQAYKEKYEALANQNLGPDETPVSLDHRQVLSEIFAEHASAVFNSIPIGKMGLFDGSKNYAREVYGMVGRGLEKIGARQPELAPTMQPKTSTGLGIEPSMRLSQLIENVIQAKRLDGMLPGHEGEIVAKPGATDKNQELTPAKTGANDQKGELTPSKDGENGPIQNAQPVAKEPIPVWKKGDPAGDIRDANGVVVGEDAVVTKVNDDNTVDISYVHPDSGERMTGTVAISDLPTSRITVGAVNPNAILQHPGPVTSETPFYAAGAVTAGGNGLPVGSHIQNTVRPQAAEPSNLRPNLRVTPAQQEALTAKATPDVQRQNRETLSKAVQLPRHEIPVFEAEYRSALSDRFEPDQKVRAEQRRLSDAAEREAELSGKENVLKTRYSKLILPYKFLDGEVPRLFSWSGDKYIQNGQIISQWLREKGHPEIADYLTSARFADETLQAFENTAHGYSLDGSSFVRPADARPDTITSEDPNYSPHKLDRTAARWIATLHGFELPKKLTPTQAFFKRMAEVNGIEPKHLGNGVYENNPIREKLREDGFDLGLLNSAVENLRLDNITSPLRERPDISLKAGDTAVAQGLAFMPTVRSTLRGNDETRSVARDYVAHAGINDEPHDKYAPVDEQRMKKIADVFADLKHDPKNPAVEKAYTAMANETMSQYRAMEKAGVQIEPWSGKGEPYANSHAMMQDVRDNKHLYFFKTENGFGQGADVSGNPLLKPAGVSIKGEPLVVNDVFRAVHDYFGHTAEGYEFGPRGEYNAYLAHSRMFSDEAKPALAAETLAQNAWVNFGPHLRRDDGSLPRPGEEGHVPLKDRKFADQKSTVIPQDILDEVDAHGRGASYMPETDASKAPGKGEDFESRLRAAWDRYDDTGESTIEDFVDQAEGLAGDTNDPRAEGLARAIEKYRDEQNDDRDMAGRNDMDAAEERLVRAVRKAFRPIPTDGKPAYMPKSAGARAGDEVEAPRGTRELRGSGTAGAEGRRKVDAEPVHAAQAPQLAGKSRLEHSIPDASVDLVHFSGNGNIESVSPSHFGKGLATPADRRGLAKSFFYVQGSDYGQDEGHVNGPGKSVYGARVAGDRIYDANADPLNWHGIINREKADQTLKDAGYAGLATETNDGRQVVALFKPVKVEKLKNDAVSFMPSHDEDGEPVQRGWWMAPDGELHEMEDDDHHHRWAARLLKERGKPFNLFEANEILKKEGWIRLVQEGEDLFVDTKRRPTVTQEKLINRLEDEEGLIKQKLPSFMPETSDDVRETRAYRSIVKNLTPEERGGLRKDTAAKLVDIYKELPADSDFETAVKLGGSKKGWYARAAKTLREIFGPDTEKFVSLLAATSPRQSVVKNLAMSLEAWKKWDDAGRPQDPKQLEEMFAKDVELEARLNNVVRAFTGQDLEDAPIKSPKKLNPDTQLSGFKVESFRRNLLNDLNHSTNDSWMAQFAGIPQSLFGTKSGYLAFTAKVRRVASKMDIKPAEVQETIWSFFKTVVEKTTVDLPAKQVLANLSEKDILNTPEFHELLTEEPEILTLLHKLGLGEDRIANLRDPEVAGRRAAASAGPLASVVLPEGKGRERVLSRLSARAQRIKDAELAGKHASGDAAPDEEPY